jgi:hypothetical protein
LKKIDIAVIPAFNLSAILTVGEIPSLSIIESVFKILVLVATLVFTIVRTIQIVKNKKQNTKEQ